MEPLLVLIGLLAGGTTGLAFGVRLARCRRAHVPQIRAELVSRVRELVAGEAQDADANGELKRHRVYARLVKEFPSLSRRAISYAIELAVLELG